MSIEIQMCVSLHACVFVYTNFSHVFRLVHQDGSLADLTMLSASSVEAILPREEQEKQEEWGTELKEKEQALVVVMPDTDMTGEKPRSFSDQRQSSTDESHFCSAGTEPEPSTEQSSGTEHAINHSMAAPNIIVIFLINQLLGL